MGNAESAGAEQPDPAEEEEDEDEDEELVADTERGPARAGLPAPGSALGAAGGPEAADGGAGPGSAAALSLGCGPGPAVLFQQQRLREAAARVRDEVAENVVQQHHSHLIRWLEERLGRGEDTVRLAQFCDLLGSRFAVREECEEAFAQFDAEGDGTVAVENMLESLKTSGGANLRGELSHVIRQLQACSLTPGFVDIFSKNKERMGVHAAKILRFLHRNRIPSNAIPFPMMDSYNNICAMRSSVLKDCLKQLLEKKNEQAIQCPTDMNGERDLDKLKVVTKCYTTLETSSNSTDVDKMINGETTSYWQSDGSSCSHWIRLRLKPDVVLKHLSIAVSASDQSYMPQQVTVSLGRNPSNMQEIRDVRIPSNMTGYITLLENASINHPFVQINIKRCHGDGCDTRIHGLKTMGYQVMKKSGVSVSDASAIWYLTLLTTLVTASVETNPDLAQSVLQITQKALQHMPPLSLTAGSTVMPSFMSTNVLEKVDSFLIRIAGCCASPEAELTLLAFALARGSVAKVMMSLLTISDHLDAEYEASQLLTAMASVRLNQLHKYGKPLQLTVEACDAKEGKEKGFGPTAVLYESLLGDGFLSEAGHTRASFILSTRTKLAIQVTQIRVKVHNGAKGAKCGLVFAYNDESETFDAEKHFKRFEKYNKWKLQEFRQFVKERNSDQRVDLDGDDPVGWFELEDEWNETEVKLPICRISKYLMVKFLCPRQEDENNVRIGIKHLSIRGYVRPANQECVSFSDTTPSGLVTGQTLVLKTLYFIQQLAQDAAELKERKLKQKPYLDFSDLNLQLFWNFYKKFRENQELECLLAQTILLQLLQNCLVLLSGSHSSQKAQGTAQPGTERKQPIDTESACDLYVYLCEVVDGEKYDTVSGMLRKEAVNTILSGAAIFFPDVNTRRSQLFKMMETITEPSQPHSATITFQSLCHYFSNQDPSGLLQLPQKGVPEEFDINSIMMVMDTLLLVATRECELTVVKQFIWEEWPFLVNLLWALQGHLLSWCYLQLKGSDVLSVQHAREILLNYVKRHISCASNVLDFLMLKCSGNKIMAKLNDSFLAMATRQLVIFLLELSNLEIPHCELLQAFAPLAKMLKNLCCETGDDFIKLGGENLEKSEEPVFLRMWSMESTHNYENNSHATTVFVCPGATLFEVEFDEKCETEKRYDYLEFTDSRGVKVRYDGKVGTEKWPTLVTFKSGPRLQFLFHSDNCNNEWGYKFMVKAYGLPDVRVPWVADLQLLVSRLMGCLASRALSLNSACGLFPSVELSVEKVTSVVESQLWKPILRHGTCAGVNQYPVGTKDSTSAEETELSKDDVQKFLLQVALWDPSQDDVTDSQTDLIKRLVSLCKKQSAKLEVVSGIGLGSKVDQAVNSVFAAMLYHSTDLHSALRTYVKSGGTAGFNDEIAEVYALAEGMKTWIMERKQKYVMMISDKEEVQDDDKMNPENINENWIGKSLLLLKFAPLPTKNIDSSSDEKRADTLQEQEDVLLKSVDQPAQLITAQSTTLQEPIVQSQNTVGEKPQQAIPPASTLNNDLDPAGQTWTESPASSVSTTPSENLTSPYVDFHSPFSSKPKAAFSKGRLRLLSLRSMEEFKVVPIQDKYPILKSILAFMKDPNISSESVLQVLSLRKAQAKNIINVLRAVSECLQSLGQPHLFQFSCILFLQEMLTCQKELISYHQQLEGCGKELWSELRQTYYNLVLLLVTAVRQFNTEKDWSLLPALSCVQTCLLHLLDMSWEAPDISFFNDINLPDLLLAMSQENISIHDSAIHQWSEEDEIADYECNKEWMEECQDGIQLRVWYERMTNATAEEKRRMHMFVARYCDLLNVEISCDGCHKIAPWHRYRCLQCPDMDLCKTCFLGGVMPEHHEDYHKMVNMEYACDHCQGLIIGRRINCNVCDDFDLCYGCYSAKKYPDSHLPTHSITVFPMVTIRISDRHRLIQPYIHNYTWLLFSALALYTADIVTEQKPAEEDLDPCVRSQAEALEARCTELITEYLLKAHQGKSLKNSAVLSLLSNVSTEGEADITDTTAGSAAGILSITDHSTSNQHQESIAADDQREMLSDTQSRDGQEAVQCRQEKIQKKLKSSASDTTLASIDSIEWESVQVLEVPGSRSDASYLEKGTVSQDSSSTSDSEMFSSSQLNVPAVAGSASEDEVKHTSSVISTSSSQQASSGASSKKSKVEQHLNTSLSEQSSPLSVASTSGTTEPSESGTVSKLSSSDAAKSVATESVPQSSVSGTQPFESRAAEQQTPAMDVRMLRAAGPKSAWGATTDHSRGSKAAFKMDVSEKEALPSQDQVFAECLQERILGLLAAMLPPVKSDSTICLPNLRQVLKLLFRLAMQNPGQLLETYHLTLGLLGQLLMRISPEEADAAVKEVLFASWTLLSTAEGKLKHPGWMTTQVLFSLGAVCLDCRISLDWASSVADILRDLNSSPQWQKVIAAFTKRCIEELPFRLKRTNVFALLVLVGFPEVLCRGTHTVYIDNANEAHDVIVLKHFTEKIQAVVIDTKTRKRKTVRDYRLTQVCEPEWMTTQSQLIQFLQHFMLIYSHLLQTNMDSSFPDAVEATWLQSLALKGLYKMLQKHNIEEIHPVILQSGLIKLLEKKCTKGTGFSKLWLLCDLETLSIMMYSSKKEASASAEGADAETEEQEQTPDHESKSSTSVFDLDETKPDPLEGLDEATKICFQITHDALNAPLHILRAMYELQMRKTDSFFLEVQKRFDGHVITTDETIQSMSMKWQPNKTSHTEDHNTKAVDTDMMIVPCVSKPLRCEKAVEESNPVSQKLITNTESDLQLSFAKQRRTKSSMLLHKELDTRSKRAVRDYLYKVNEAISILYARHVLASLLANWPSGVAITEEVLGLSCPSHMAYILDLLMQLEEKPLWEKILQRVLLGCSENILGSLAVTACQFMEEPGMDVQIRESKHPYDNNTTIEDKVHIPGAIYLSVKFDPHCVSEDGCDELLMSSSSDYKQDRHTFSGSSHKWIDFDIPGDTLYYRFTSDLDTNDWGYKFTVTGGHRGRFLTGFEILKQMLLEERVIPHLPLAEIWEWQVGVACQQMGHQRLKAIHLLLKILQCTSSSGCDLTMLRPLWQLFTKMENNAHQDQTGIFILPPLHRALTELFYVAEKRAMELGVLHDYFLALTTEDHIHHCVMQGLKNVAAISLAINQQNKATKLLSEQATSQTKPA
ncbi:LOW QUALITY PROTEIN: zinc finger ZZ-type and EF-hand domain-containing protein 1 [Pristis pectinata]|uniref:LOW QUALITY PROTEIN: zinc finger ZZ-type and EF-hand domain-containing protein 1 n=1 Tax=Pristis pectinata TaxID=685728 RepID=UPI00223E0A09|nr:LOW QUALITY PROTEIN: zinc finger ZZ-type and EF-hand domain-containing protein 1 [Pristis pectinata]